MPDDVSTSDANSGSGGGGGGLSAKVGPLPVWGWFLVVAGVLGVYLIYRRRAGSNATAASGTPTITGSTAGVTSIDPLTGDQLLTSLQNLNGYLQSFQQAAQQAGNFPALIAGDYLNSGGIAVYDGNGNRLPGMIRAQSILHATGPGFSANGLGLIPVDFLSGGYFVSEADVKPYTGAGGASMITTAPAGIVSPIIGSGTALSLTAVPSWPGSVR